MVPVKALKEQIPKSDQRVKETLVEALRFESGQFAQGLERQELDKEDQELGRSERRRGWWGFWVAGRFFRWYLVCIYYNMHTLHAIVSL